MINNYKIKSTLVVLLTFFILLSSCGIYKKTDSRKIPTNANERIKKNMEEGRGFRLGSIGKKSTNFEFATSNPLWRAALEKLDFAPLNNVDYAGGIIVTDWFSDGSSKDQIKITIRFLSNEIRSDALETIIHKKTCNNQNNCKIIKIQNDMNYEIKLAILKKAANLKNSDVASSKEKNESYKIPGKQF
jgi:hypothetical protein